MALVRNNNEYVKIELDKYYIENGQVLVPVTFYQDASHRIFEKENKDKILSFIQKATNHIELLQNNLDNYLKTLCPNATTPKDYQQYATLLNNDTMLNQLQTQLNSFYEEFDRIQSILTGDSPNDQIFVNLDLFKSLGLEENWLNNPIIVTRKAIINVGTVEGATPSGDTIYRLLKLKMPNTIDDL